MTVKIIDPSWFVSQQTLRPIEFQYTRIKVIAVPPQFPPGYSEAKTIEQAETVTNSVKAIMIIQLVL